MSIAMPPAESQRLRVQLEMKIHKVYVVKIAAVLKCTDGHVKQSLFYGRESGADRCWALVIEGLGFDPRVEVSPEVKQFAADIAGLPSQEGLGAVAQG